MALVAASSGAITVPTGGAGVYLVICGWESTTGFAGITIFDVLHNATAKATSDTTVANTSYATTASSTVNAAAGDTFSCNTTTFAPGMTLAGNATERTFLAVQKLW